MTIETPLPYGRDSMELYTRKLMNPHMARKQNHQQGAGEYDICAFHGRDFPDRQRVIYGALAMRNMLRK